MRLADKRPSTLPQMFRTGTRVQGELNEKLTIPSSTVGTRSQPASEGETPAASLGCKACEAEAGAGRCPLNRHPWSRCCVAVWKGAEGRLLRLWRTAHCVSGSFPLCQALALVRQVGARGGDRGLHSFSHSFSRHSVWLCPHCRQSIFPWVTPGTRGGDRGLMAFIHSLLHLVNTHSDLLP